MQFWAVRLRNRCWYMSYQQTHPHIDGLNCILTLALHALVVSTRTVWFNTKNSAHCPHRTLRVLYYSQ